MRKIDLDELYGGYWEWHDHYGDGKGGILQIKPLREHLQEWVKMTDYYFVRNNKQYIQDLLNGTGELEVEDEWTGEISFCEGYNDLYGGAYEDEALYEDYDGVWFLPLEIAKKDIADKAREQGIRPPKTWYREEVDRLAYNAVNPDLPF